MVEYVNDGSNPNNVYTFSFPNGKIDPTHYIIDEDKEWRFLPCKLIFLPLFIRLDFLTQYWCWTSRIRVENPKKVKTRVMDLGDQLLCHLHV